MIAARTFFEGMTGPYGSNAPVWMMVPLHAWTPETEKQSAGLAGYQPPPPGWNSGLCAPPAPGIYERLTSHLGRRVDRWDGIRWVRRSKRGNAPPVSVACANQFWPWRVVHG